MCGTYQGEQLALRQCLHQLRVAVGHPRLLQVTCMRCRPLRMRRSCLSRLPPGWTSAWGKCCGVPHRWAVLYDVAQRLEQVLGELSAFEANLRHSVDPKGLGCIVCCQHCHSTMH